MTVFENMLTRRSVKAYKSDAVPKELIDRVIEAGLYAASGRNKQSAIVIAVTDKAMRDRLSKMNAAVMGAEIDPFYGAPVVLVVLADKQFPTYVYDGSLMLGNMMLAAHELGLGSCWIHRAKEEFESEEGKEILRSLGIEGDYEGIGHLVLGYAATDPNPASPRRDGRVYEI
ncbi:MAG: nitroreductase [Clostridia bacterium]|nr:nitroreductase [Clostridia bacterium]